MAFLLTLLFLICTAVPALAYTVIDTKRETSLTVFYKKNDKVISGASFSLYRVADMSDRAYYTLSGDYQNYAVELNGLDGEGWRAAAETLAAYTARDGYAPSASGTTDDRGMLSFEELNTGLYLLVGERLTIGNDTYIPEPSLISLPGTDSSDDLLYERMVSPKAEVSSQPGGEDPDPDHVSRKVLKVWKNDSASQRPAQVTVQLLQDGAVYDTVALSEENGWSHTWTGLDKDHDWQVTEKEVPSGYVVSVSREGITFVMTNRKPSSPGGGDPGGGDPPGGGGNPPGGGGDTPGGNTPGGNTPEGGTDTSEGGGTPPGPRIERGPEPLPQTGVLWYPVPLLAGSGLLIFLIGWYLRRQ